MTKFLTVRNGVIAGVCVAVAAGGGIAMSSGRWGHHAVVQATHGPSQVTADTSPPATAAPVGPPCPLTGLPAAGGAVPSRPALAVKVDAIDGARPQAGLDKADIVFEEPVEGGLTRFVAVFQCSDASRVEPIRSGRLVDPDLLSQFGHPLLAYSGAIDPVVAKIAASAVYDVGIDRISGPYLKDPNRAAPHEMYASTDALWQSGKQVGAPQTAPSPVFTYGTLTSASQPATRAHIAFSPYDDVVWSWSATKGAWLRSNLDSPSGASMLTDGNQVSASNVVIEQVQTSPSPYVEDASGIHENDVTTTGSGQLTVLRDGVEVTGTWSRPSIGAPASLVDQSGQPISLAPGVTWVELVPQTAALSVGR